MSDCGGIVVGALALPLAMVVLLVAGVTYVALRAAGMACRAALDGIEFIGTRLGSSVRAATEAISAAGTSTLSAIDGATEWTKTLIDSSALRDRIRGSLETTYARMLSGTSLACSNAIENGSSQLSATGHPIVEAPSISVGVPTLESAATIAAPQPALPISAGAAQERAAEILARARAVGTVLNGEVPLRLVAEVRSGARLVQGANAVSEAESALRSGDFLRATTLATTAEQVLTTVAHDAYKHLVKAERATIAAQVGNTLKDRGYEVRVAHSSKGVAVVGRRDHYTLAMVLRPAGRMEFDMAGFEGGSCHSEAQELLQGFKRNGLLLSETDVRWHGRFDGGALIRAARDHGKPLEQALGEIAPQNLPDPLLDKAADSGSTVGPVRRQTVLGRDRNDYQRAKAWMWGHTQRQATELR